MSWDPFELVSTLSIVDLQPKLVDSEAVEKALRDTWTNLNVVINPDSFRIILSHLLDNPYDNRFNHIFSDPNFRNQLNAFLFNSFPFIKDFWADSYANISFFISLLSKWFEWTFFEDWNFYNDKNFEELFDVYISKITSFEWDYEGLEFSSYVTSFANICWVLNLICVLSHNDNLRRDFIEKSALLINTKIRDVLYFLDSKNINDKKLRNSLLFPRWLTYLNFSHLKYIPFEKSEWEDESKKLDLFLDEYDKIVDDIIFWYKVCEDSDFWNDPWKRKSMIKWVEVWNLSYTVSLILLKLSWKVDDEELFSNEKFRTILWKFLNEVYSEWQIPNYNSIDDIKKIVNNVFIKFYNGWNYSDIPEDLSNKDIDSNASVEKFLENIENWWTIDTADKMEILHHLLLFNDWLSVETLFKIWRLLNSKEYSGLSENWETEDQKENRKRSVNINYEVMKLKIFNIILTRLVDSWVGINELSWFLDSLSNYIDHNKKSSQLLYSYSLLYVTIWYCYSFSDYAPFYRLALDNYAKFRQINPWKFDFSRYGIDIDIFYSNIWKFISEYDETWGELSQLSDVDRASFLTKSWKWHADRYSKWYTERSKTEANKSLELYIDSLEWKPLNLDALWVETSNSLWVIFNWVTDVKIIDKHSSRKYPPIPNYLWLQEIELTNWYFLQITYPKIYKDMYEEFLSNATDFIPEIKQKLKKYLETFKEDNKEYFERVGEFEDALDNWKVSLVYQPICMADWTVDKYEVLSRVNEWSEIEVESLEDWKIKRRKINIQDYIDAIEKLWRNDLLKRLRDEVIFPSIIWELNNGDWSNFSINLGYFDFIDNDFIAWLERRVKQWEIKPEKITFELLEWKWPNKDNKEVFSNLKKLREMWFKIAMDDYWAWDSGGWRLAELLELWLIDYIKIDKKIIERLWSNDSRVRRTAISMIKWVVELANIWWPNWTVKVVAEYIKDDEIFRRAEELWVHLFQWYYFSPPLKPLDFKEKFIPMY